VKKGPQKREEQRKGHGKAEQEQDQNLKGIEIQMSIMPKFQRKLINICARNDFSLLPLGEVGKWPIWLIRTSTYKPKNKRILIVSGFHGEERAGPWAVLEWLRQFRPENYKGFDISCLPVANPIAFNKYTRYNTWNQKSNCGFCHPEMKEEPSEEGKILIKHLDRLYSLGMNGFLSLHEDIELRKEYYLYTFEPTKEPGQFTCELLGELARWFEKPLNGVSVTADTSLKTPPFVVNGLVYKYCDGSLEDYMFHRGVPRIAVTETPARARLEKRILANMSLIDIFIDLIRKGT